MTILGTYSPGAGCIGHYPHESHRIFYHEAETQHGQGCELQLSLLRGKLPGQICHLATSGVHRGRCGIKGQNIRK